MITISLLDLVKSVRPSPDAIIAHNNSIKLLFHIRSSAFKAVSSLAYKGILSEVVPRRTDSDMYMVDVIRSAPSGQWDLDPLSRGVIGNSDSLLVHIREHETGSIKIDLPYGYFTIVNPSNTHYIIAVTYDGVVKRFSGISYGIRDIITSMNMRGYKYIPLDKLKKM